MGTVNLRVVVDNTQKEFDEKNKWVVTRHDIFGGRAQLLQLFKQHQHVHFERHSATDLQALNEEAERTCGSKVR